MKDSVQWSHIVVLYLFFFKIVHIADYSDSDSDDSPESLQQYVWCRDETA